MTVQNLNIGLLSKNTRRENENQPTHRGEANIGGVQYKISGWTRVRNDNTAFLKLAFSVALTDAEAEQEII